MLWARLCKTFIVQAHELSKLQQVLHSLSALVLSLKKKKWDLCYVPHGIIR